MVIFKDQSSKSSSLTPDEMSNICGGRQAQSASFPCTVVEGDGSTRTKEVSSIQECLEFAGMN